MWDKERKKEKSQDAKGTGSSLTGAIRDVTMNREPVENRFKYVTVELPN